MVSYIKSCGITGSSNVTSTCHLNKPCWIIVEDCLNWIPPGWRDKMRPLERDTTPCDCSGSRCVHGIPKMWPASHRCLSCIQRLCLCDIETKMHFCVSDLTGWFSIWPIAGNLWNLWKSVPSKASRSMCTGTCIVNYPILHIYSQPPL